MDFITLVIIALGLSMDCFAVAIGTGVCTRRITKPEIFRMAVFFGAFQGLMPMIGWYIGFGFRHIIAAYDHWVAFVLLTFLGIRMIYEGLGNAHTGKIMNNFHLKTLISLAFATSIDALAVGFSLAFLNISLWISALVIGLVSFLITILGIYIGSLFHKRIRFNFNILGGVILIGIGIKIFLEHTIS